MYIDYDYYVEKGGAVDCTAFPLLERKARRKLDLYTFNRLKDIPEQSEDVKLLMVDLIEMLNDDRAKISSFNNDGVSVSYKDFNLEGEIRALIVGALPVSLVCAVASKGE